MFGSPDPIILEYGGKRYQVMPISLDENGRLWRFSSFDPASGMVTFQTDGNAPNNAEQPIISFPVIENQDQAS